MWLASVAIQGETRQNRPLPSAWPGFGAGGRPPTSPEGGRSLQQGRSGHYRGWKRWSHWPSRVQFTAEQMPRLTRAATAPQVPLALSLSL